MIGGLPRHHPRTVGAGRCSRWHQKEETVTDSVTVDRTLDCKGMLCPMPIVKLAKLAKELEPGQVVMLEATDPGAIPDVEAWSKNTGNPVVSQDKVGNVMRFWIQKA
jgi:TusA-related sulfurtransferase